MILFLFERCFIFLPPAIIWFSAPMLNPPENMFLSPLRVPPLIAFIISLLRLNVFTKPETSWTSTPAPAATRLLLEESIMSGSRRSAGVIE